MGIVGALLFRRQHGKAQAVGQRAPAGAFVIGAGRLAAAMQDHHQRRSGRQLGRGIEEHAQIARIGAKAAAFRQPAGPGAGAGRGSRGQGRGGKARSVKSHSGSGG